MHPPFDRPAPALPGDPSWEGTIHTLQSKTGFSRRRAEIGLCYRAGLSKKEAAIRIGCSLCSVGEHTRRIYREYRHLGISNQATLAAFVEWILITRPDVSPG